MRVHVIRVFEYMLLLDTGTMYQVFGGVTRVLLMCPIRREIDLGRRRSRELVLVGHVFQKLAD